MRTAHVITRMIVGGAQENTLHNCLDLIDDFDDDVLLITGPSLGPEGDLLAGHDRVLEVDRAEMGPVRGRAGRAEKRQLPVCRLPSLRRAIHPRDVLAVQSLWKVLRQFRPDVVHTHSAKGGLLGRGVAWRMNVPAVVHTVHGAPFHDYQSTAARRFFVGCERWAAGRCHHMISVADAMTDLMVEAAVAPRSKFTTIQSGMDVEPFLNADADRTETRRRLGFADQDIVVGKIARLFHLKGHDDLVDSAAAVVAANPRVRYLLVGDGVLRQSLTDRIESLGLRSHFVFAGLVPPGEVPSLVGAMDLLVHTSLREGLARALPQALIAGKPVVSYDIDGAREVTVDDQTGYLVPPRDLDRLSGAIIRLAGDEDLRRRLGGQGRARWTEPFRHRTMTRRVREVYDRVLRDRTSVGRRLSAGGGGELS